MTSVIKRAMTGYSSFDNIKYLSVYDAAFKTKIPMKFYNEPLEHIVDVSWGFVGDSIRITIYPHNAPDCLVRVHQKYSAIVDKLNETIVNQPKREFVTMDVGGDIPRIITPKDFASIYPSTKFGSVLFIFQNDKGQGSFPRIFALESSQRTGNIGDVFTVMTNTSVNIADVVENQTEIGKQFTYFLLQSYRTKTVITNFPSLDNVSFPTRGNSDPTNFVNLESLRKFADSCHPEKIIMKTEGQKLVDEIPPKKEEEPVSDEVDARLEAIAENSADEEDVDSPPWRHPMQFPFGEPDTKELALRIQKNILEKNSIQFSDLITMGVLETIGLIPITDRIIDVDPEMSLGIRKMCIYENQVHIVPSNGDFDAVDFFGESESLFHVCTEETYPKKALPSPKNGNYLH